MADRASTAASGVIAAGAGLAAAELAAGIVPNGRSPVVAVGDFLIHHIPGPMERWAIRTFGHNDKAALIVGTLLALALLGALAANLQRSRPSAAATLVVVIAAAGTLAALAEQDAGPLDILPPAAGALAAVTVLTWLRRLDDGEPVGPLRPEASSRRTFLLAGTAAAAVSAAAVAAGRALQLRVDAAASRAKVVLPKAAKPLPAIPAGADFRMPGLTSFVTPNRSFYRIDTALVIPQVEAESWELRIHGRTKRELVLTYDDLLRRPMVEADITIACVSNEVGDHLIGNARWLGVRLADLLNEVEPDAGADQLIGRSVDGFTTGAPLRSIFDGRDALVVVGMNGEPLPVRHGFPARVVIAGLYGYVSATKWVKELEVSRFADYDAYWIQRAWALPGPIKLESRIDVPGGDVKAGPVPVAGVAWAQGRGIAGVEVQVDDGPWQQAELAEQVGLDTWRQWRWTWQARPGDHELRVRATAGDGEVQPEQRTPPFPAGATGWHTRYVTAS